MTEVRDPTVTFPTDEEESTGVTELYDEIARKLRSSQRTMDDVVEKTRRVVGRLSTRPPAVPEEDE